MASTRKFRRIRNKERRKKKNCKCVKKGGGLKTIFPQSLVNLTRSLSSNLYKNFYAYSGKNFPLSMNSNLLKIRLQ